MERQYNTIENVNIARNYFNMSYGKTLSIEVGKLVPICIEMLLPGEVVKLKQNSVIRQMPTISPSFSNFKMVTRYFIIPLRILDPDIYYYISGYKKYGKAPFTGKIKKWKPSKPSKTGIGTLWDYCDLPIRCVPDDDSLPIDAIRLGYNAIHDYYYRNETIQESILEDGDPAKSTNEDLLSVNWDRDYFTTALPYQQLGEPIGIPITGNAVANFGAVPTQLTEIHPNQINGDDRTDTFLGTANGGRMDMKEAGSYWNTNPFSNLMWSSRRKEGDDGIPTVEDGKLLINQELQKYLNKNYVDMSKVSSVLISELRLATALQRDAEMLARGGVREKEILNMYWGISPSDETLGLPKYIGSHKVNILTSEVLQTSATNENSPLGDMGGHGLGVGQSGTIKYHAKEICLLFGLSHIKPDTRYGGQGMPRKYVFNSRYDFPIPILQHLSEQPIYKRELVCASIQRLKKDWSSALSGATVQKEAKEYNSEIFGYRPIYDSWRANESRINGLLRRDYYYIDADTIDYSTNLSNWTEARFFSIKNGERPALNDDFLKCKIDNRNFAVVGGDIASHQFLADIYIEMHSWKPLSKEGTPSII